MPCCIAIPLYHTASPHHKKILTHHLSGINTALAEKRVSAWGRERSSQKTQWDTGIEGRKDLGMEIHEMTLAAREEIWHMKPCRCWKKSLCFIEFGGWLTGALGRKGWRGGDGGTACSDFTRENASKEIWKQSVFYGHAKVVLSAWMMFSQYFIHL